MVSVAIHACMDQVTNLDLALLAVEATIFGLLVRLFLEPLAWQHCGNWRN
jgi:hypothetical protein